MAYKIYIEKQGTPHPNLIDVRDGSLEELPKISTKIKPIDRDKANSELEKGEVVLDPDTGALHKVLGKPHSKGGTPTLLKDDSFIFSNFKNLAIKKDEKELFEFKIGGKYKPLNNTPSKVLEKEVDFEHHNKMIDILANEKKYTKQTVNSAKLMMLKNLEKVGQIAFLQESKKEHDIPAFAVQTAPIYSKQTDDQINQSMQYMQSGGKKLTEEEIALAEQNYLKDIKGWNFRFKTGSKSYYDRPSSNITYPKMTNQQWLEYLKNETPEQKTRRKSREAQQNLSNKFGFTKENIDAPLPRTAKFPYTYYEPPKFNIKSPDFNNIIKLGNSPGNPTGITDPTNHDTKLTPWQKINIGIPFYRALNVKTQYPLRQHQESVIPQLENINVQPQLDNNNQAYFNAASLTKGINPSQSSAIAQQLFGNRLSANNQAIGNVQQANVATQNQQKMLAAASLNQDAGQNRLFDKQYYDQTQVAIKNTRDLKEAYTDQGINNLNSAITKKLGFDSWLNTQEQFRGKPTYIDENGVQHYEGKPLYSPKAGFWGNSVIHNPTNIDWSTYQSGQTSMEDDDQAYVRNIRELIPGVSDDKVADLLRERTKKKSLAAYSAANLKNMPPFKMGGKFRSKKPC